MQFDEPVIDELLESLSWEEFLTWKLMYEREPWGPRRDDLRAGVIARMAGHSPGNPLDLFPVKEDKQPLTVAESQQTLKG